MESAVRYSYDALLAMQDIGSPAITASAAGASALSNNPLGGPVSLYKLPNNGPRPLGDIAGHFGLGSFDVVVNVAAAPVTTNETYALHFQTSANGLPGDTWVDQEVITITPSLVGKTVGVSFLPETMKAIDPNAAFVRVYATLTGAAPSLTYWAFASQHSHV